ncbi:type II secretion system protein GspK [Yersinia kristensenii]|uniref:type II secretion system protein GspK n=1 Tax=Yersinia kristensenii TaxID=28152 RepID=UPI0005DC1916|nr:type II secretion system protein GspK [Yersinia kristensenii]CNH27206.1 general secretion pathway protein K [Yersinia kristensenii]CNK88063.1 general secretion pathway protein K [Yersinia kristensenii]
MKQRGVALLLVLSVTLLMSTMVSIAYFYLIDMLYFVANSQLNQSNKRLLLSSEDVFLKNIVEKMLNKASFETIPSMLLTSESVIRINNRDVHYKIIDRTNCFNVNTLHYNLSYINNDDYIYPWLVLKYLLQLNDIQSTVLNEIIMELNHAYQANSKKININSGYGHSVLAIRNALLVGDSIGSLLNIDDEDFLKIVPFLCYRNDTTLLVNINTLKAKHSPLLQAIFMNEINESDINKAILFKSNNKFETIDSFFDFIVTNSIIDINKMNKIRDINRLKFLHDEYYFSSIFRLESKGGVHQLMSLFHMNEKDVTVLQRRLSFSEEYKKSRFPSINTND